MQDYFHALAGLLDRQLSGGERYQCWFEAEASDFVRFNRGLVRQAGHVRQIYLTLELINGQRHAQATCALAGELNADGATLGGMLTVLRGQLPGLPDDPHLLLAAEVHSTTQVQPSRLPPARAMVDEVLDAARGIDLVGIFAAGPIWRGYANAAGQRNWHETASFNLDWSLVHGGDKAVKSTYAGFAWDSAAFRARFDEAAARLALLRRAPVAIPPGAWRAYLTPTALGEIIGMLDWGGMSEKALRTRQSCLRRMRDEDLRLHPTVTLTENTADGLAPGFQESGFIKPGRVVLLEQGRLAGSLISPRTAKEYGIAANGAGSDEAMASADLAAGTLPSSDILAELDTGVFISNLWYLNFSDRANCRMTGMTRFATFWVEKGEIKAPLNVMRFDDSLFSLLGDKLLGLTREREMLLDTGTYGSRSTRSMRLPGALVKDLRFVL